MNIEANPRRCLDSLHFSSPNLLTIIQALTIDLFCSFEQSRTEQNVSILQLYSETLRLCPSCSYHNSSCIKSRQKIPSQARGFGVGHDCKTLLPTYFFAATDPQDTGFSEVLSFLLNYSLTSSLSLCPAVTIRCKQYCTILPVAYSKKSQQGIFHLHLLKGLVPDYLLGLSLELWNRRN